ncbi:hypothetical protein GE09DRAFT_779810 [Coniochaeta sp. 2T2.1]|nr:hypothetical protein GE09DRAFT_779810 [Coniochaeta sp. 2T2.1]
MPPPPLLLLVICTGVPIMANKAHGTQPVPVWACRQAVPSCYLRIFTPALALRSVNHPTNDWPAALHPRPINARVAVDTASFPHVFTAQLAVYVLVQSLASRLSDRTMQGQAGPIVAAAVSRAKFQPTCHQGWTKEINVDKVSREIPQHEGLSLPSPAARGNVLLPPHLLHCCLMP